MKTSRFVLSALLVLFTAIGLRATIGIPYQMQLGNPSGATADTSNHTHYLIQKAQYALDYNDTTHEPNWVSWSLTSNDVGGSGRSPDFFVDTGLPAGFYQVLTTDYSGSGYDRGHMCPSADRTVTRADNDVTFFMSNMVPQTPDNNQGIWASFENYCRTLAAAGNEVLITSGTSGFTGSTVASGVAIPGYTWKVVVVVPLGPGAAVDRIVANSGAVRVIAIKVPNIAGIRGTPWENFVTSPAQIQSDTGFTFFTALPAPIAAAFRATIDGQTTTGAPVIVVQPVPQTAPVGGNATFTVEANGNAPLTYQWFHGEVEIPGATSASLDLTGVQAADVGSYSVVVTNDVGSTTSSSADLIVSGLPPTITTGPVGRSVDAGSNVSFTVVASGSAPFSYQWHKVGELDASLTGNISGANTPTLTLTNVQAASAGLYFVTVSNTVGAITSDQAGLAVVAAAPTIASQPANQSLAPGSNTTFSVVATGTAPLNYQWYKGASPISTLVNPSAGTSTLVLNGITLGDGGNYSVVVSNGVGTPATSSSASLTISSASPTQIFYTGGTLVQDFNTLPGSGTFANGSVPTAVIPLSGAPANASGLGGWTYAQTLAAGTQRFTVSSGTSTTGSVFSFGATAASERALGMLSSGSNYSVVGTVIVNNTGQTINTVTLGYTGEQWRWTGTAGDKLMVEYRVGGSDIVSGPFTPVPALDFASPVQSGAAAPVDGNAPANRGSRSTNLTSLSWAPGQSLVIRWRQLRTSSADGLAVDDFSLSTTITGPSGPSVASTSPANSAANLPLNTAIAITFDQAVNAAGSAFTINSASRGAVPATLSVSADGKTYTFTPPTNFDFLDTVSVKVLAAGVTSVSTGLHLGADYDFSFVTAAPVAPSITAQPAAQLNISAGGSASFTVGMAGTAPFTYQWRKGGLAITGNPTAATATLVLGNVQAGDVGSYDVVVGNGIGSPVTSNPAALTVAPAAPQIITQPVGQTVAVGDTVTLTVAAKGTTPFTYQWRKGGAAISGNASATTATLVLPNVTVLNSGSYDVVVSNGVGSPATSNAVSVLAVAPPSVLNFAGGTYTQDFDTLPSTGTFTFTGNGPFSLDAFPGVNAAGLAGWSFVKYSGSGANALFKFDNGASNSGSVVSYGLANAPDRALGSLSSGSTVSRVGVTLVNTTGHTVNYVTIAYTGEQWRRGSAAANKFAFEYAVGSADINTGTFTAVPALDFIAPVTTGADVLLDGNLAANRVPGITATVTGLNWAPGQKLVLRWTDVNDGGNDDALAIDDFSLTDAPPVPAITAQPVDLTVSAFTPASFSVGATSLTPLTFQWQKNGAPITDNPSALTDTLLIASATAADAGVYDCVVTNSFGSTLSGAAALATTKVIADVVLDGLNVVYDGTPKAASAVTTPDGLAVMVTYDGGLVAPTNAGTYAVVATVEDENYTGSATGELTINKAPATVTLSNLDQTYSGAPRVAGAGTNPIGLPVMVTYDGDPAAPVNAGSYNVVGVIADANYVGSATGTLTVAKAVSAVSLSGLGQTYTGAPRAVTAGTTPVGLTVALTYDGVAAAPTNAGSYNVVATVIDANYVGTATGTLVVDKAAAPVTLGNLTATYDGTPKAATATTAPGGLNVTFTYDGGPVAPTNAGSYSVVGTVDDANHVGTATGTLTIAKATATVTLGNLSQTYDGAPKPASATVDPSSQATTLTYDGSATAPTNAGSYAVVATVSTANYTGTASGTLVVAKATASVALSQLAQVYDGTAKPVTVTTTPAGLTMLTTYNGVTTAPTNTGSYAVSSTVVDLNYTGTAAGTLVISQGQAVITLSNLKQAYDGAPKPVTVTTTPATLPVTVTYDGFLTVPTNPGSYAVVATSTDANRPGSASGTLVITVTALVRHAPAFNGGVDGSVQMLLPEAVTLNGSAVVTGDLLVPGSPTMKLNGQPHYGGTIVGTGSATPSGYLVTLNGSAVLRHVMSRTNAIAMPVVAAPPAPAGTRDVSLNSPGQSPGNFATLRNLTLNGSSNPAGLAVPAGTYGTFTVNGSNKLIFGVAGATTPAVYNLQNLTLNGNTEIVIVGPVIINLANGTSLNGAIGAAGHSDWLTLNIAAGGLTLNSNAYVDGTVIAPNGTITINGSAMITGRVACDRLTINGSGLLTEDEP